MAYNLYFATNQIQGQSLAQNKKGTDKPAS